MRQTFKYITASLIVGALMSPALATTKVSSNTERQITTQMQQDPLVPHNQIRIKFQNRVAYLTGAVDNLMAKKRATEVALLIRSVDSVVNSIEVNPRWVKAPQIERQLQKTFRQEKAADLQKIDVQVANDGEAFLVGTVDTIADSRIAEDLAESVSGVTGVTNGISIKEISQRSPADMEKEIRNNLFWNRYITPNTLTLQVTGRQAILSGEVGSDFTKQQAIKAARVPGIHYVNSLALRVTPSKESASRHMATNQIPKDTRIEEAIYKAFLIDPYVVASMIDIDVQKGVVTLTGKVDNARARAAAGRDANNTRGVVSVNNDIIVVEAPTMAKYY